MVSWRGRTRQKATNMRYVHPRRQEFILPLLISLTVSIPCLPTETITIDQLVIFPITLRVSDVRARAWPESPGLGFKARAQAHEYREPGLKPSGRPGPAGLGPKPGLWSRVQGFALDT